MNPQAALSEPPGIAACKGTVDEERAYVTLMLDRQLCGIPVLAVRDVLSDQTITPVPLAPREVAGNLNLRGRIVTAIDLRLRLGLPARPPGQPRMAIVTEQGAELYALLVDQVCEVVMLGASAMERNPPTVARIWSDHSLGIHRLDGGLLVVLDVERLLVLEQVVT